MLPFFLINSMTSDVVFKMEAPTKWITSNGDMTVDGTIQFTIHEPQKALS